jgi:pteridine reductase
MERMRSKQYKRQPRGVSRTRGQGRVALVTGGAIRVGRLIVTGLANAGYDIVLHYHRARGDADEVADVVRGVGQQCVLVRGDLGNPSAIAKMAKAIRAQFDGLDVLVNSAANLQHAPVMDIDARRWDEVLALNARAPHLLVRELAAQIAKKRGSVLNIVDLSAVRPWPAYGVHSVSKAALQHLTRLQALALAPAVRVNALMLGDVYPSTHSRRPKAWVGRKSPLGRSVAEADVIRAVLFAISTETMTGSTIVVDAGISLTGPTLPV